MKDIVVDLAYVSDEGLFKVLWNYGKRIPGGRHYYIRSSRIEGRSKDVRDALQDLVDAGREERVEDYNELVREVAAAGYKLYEALFFGDEEQDRRTAEKARKWLAENLRPLEDSITFRLPSRIHFPWGLIYDRPVDKDTDVNEFKVNFWCHKFSAAVHYFTNAADWEQKAWPHPPFGVIFGADEEIWTATFGKLEVSERERLLALLQHPDQPIFRIDALSNRWRNRGKDMLHALLTFYCHSSGSGLSIGGATMSSDDFEELFTSTEDAPPTLVFLAGCNTAVGELHKGFFRAATGPGYCGFIGTEVKVPDVFTLRFLARFFDLFFGSGETIAQVLRALRMQHWPLSLVFSVCCPSDLRLEPAAGAMRRAEDPNLSLKTVSTE
jgi:hypothetical protein